MEDVDFADDICLLSHRYEDMQNKINNLEKEIKRAHLKINVDKTKEMRLNSSKTDMFLVKDNYIDSVTEFMYLGSVITTDNLHP